MTAIGRAGDPRVEFIRRQTLIVDLVQFRRISRPMGANSPLENSKFTSLPRTETSSEPPRFAVNAHALAGCLRLLTAVGHVVESNVGKFWMFPLAADVAKIRRGNLAPAMYNGRWPQPSLEARIRLDLIIFY